MVTKLLHFKTILRLSECTLNLFNPLDEMDTCHFLSEQDGDLKPEEWKEIFLSDDVKDCPAFIISITGPSRRGKSLLFNLILHRLLHVGIV